MKPARVRLRPAAIVLLAAAAALQGCATTTEASNPRDPWEPFNRGVYRFNEDVDRVALKPAATFYREKVPAFARTGVSNFFSNLSDAWTAVNALLQFHLQDAEESLARFHVNTMFGLFGLFDLASELNIERHHEDFGQTLGRWGVPSGPFVMLPLLGPSTVRDSLALPVDHRYDLLRTIDPMSARNAVYGLKIVDKRANLLRVSGVLEEAALDKYSFTRDAYLQRRRAEVDEGGRGEEREAPPALPDESATPPADAPATPASGGAHGAPAPAR